MQRILTGLFLSVFLLFGSAGLSLAQTDPLPSWNDGQTKQAIIDFVDAVTTEGGPDYVAPDDRIATFDNDGTLWVEQPMYVQLAFALDRLKDLSSQHPEWKEREPFASALSGGIKLLDEFGDKGVLQIVAATHAGMTTKQFDAIVTNWIATARHPETGMLYTSMIYQPMLELMDYLRANDFEVFIVSTYLQPFLSYTTKDAWTFTLNSEATYNWTSNEWSVPLNAMVSKLVTIDKQPISFQAGVRYYAASSDNGPDGFGARAAVTFLFPK